MEINKDDAGSVETNTRIQLTGSSSWVSALFFPHQLSHGSIDPSPPFSAELTPSLILSEGPSYRYRGETVVGEWADGPFRGSRSPARTALTLRAP